MGCRLSFHGESLKTFELAKGVNIQAMVLACLNQYIPLRYSRIFL